MKVLINTKNKNIHFAIIFGLSISSFCFVWQKNIFPTIDLGIEKTFSIDSLGAAQGVSIQGKKVFVYGDREVGIIREFILKNDSLVYTGNQSRLTIQGKDLINHPTGIAFQANQPTFIGNSIRLNQEGTLWKAVIYVVDWMGLQKTKTLDGNLINTIEDDTCIQGTRPEYVKYKNQWFVATADYGNKNNEVRLYNPSALKTAKKTSETGVLYKKFTCSPWVQNLLWIPEKKILVLIQNQIEGRRWRFTFLDFEKSIEQGHEVVIKSIDMDKADELEGFSLFKGLKKGIVVTSSRKSNVHLINLK